VSKITHLLESIETIHALELEEKDRQIAAHQENMSLMVTAVMTTDEFTSKRPGPWQKMNERVKALEDIAMLAKDSKKPEVVEAIKRLDATYQ
jgi:hypothetical protein